MISAPFHDGPLDGSPYFQVGEVFVYTKNGGSWQLTQNLFAPDKATAGHFGLALALDGSTLAIGAQGDNQAEGAVYIFGNTDGTWVFEEKIVAFDPASADQFGESLALEGDTLVVGARADDDQGSSSGSVYIYSRSGGSWTLDTKLVDPDGESSDSFGASVALEGDRLAVGTPGDTDMGYFSGSVTLFNRTGDWLLEDKLVVADGALYDGFGGKISLSGETLAVTADLEEEEAEQSGAVYVYTLQAGSWGLQQKLKAPGEPADGRFGRDIHLEGDTLAVASSAGEPLRIYQRVGGRMESRSPLDSFCRSGSDSHRILRQ